MHTQYNGYAHGSVGEGTILSSPFIKWGKPPAERVKMGIQAMLTRNILLNPLYQKFKCLLEYDNPVVGYPAFDGATLSGFLADHQARGPLFDMDGVDPNEGTLGLAFDVHPRNTTNVRFAPQYNVGSMRVREDAVQARADPGAAATEVPLIVGPDGTPVRRKTATHTCESTCCMQ